MAESIILETVKDALAAGSNIIDSAKNEIIWLLPPAFLVLADQYGVSEKYKMLIEKGGRGRGLTQISGINRDAARKFLDIGEEVRHIDQFQGALMLVADKRESISSMNVNVADLSLDDPIVAFWTDDQAYADFLIAAFEAEWNKAVDAEERLREL
ncbi:MAG: hypothetical protein ABSD89_06715 [Halobacteriota archaeon]|jgi:hypothetical protein